MARIFWSAEALLGHRVHTRFFEEQGSQTLQEHCAQVLQNALNLTLSGSERSRISDVSAYCSVLFLITFSGFGSTRESPLRLKCEEMDSNSKYMLLVALQAQWFQLSFGEAIGVCISHVSSNELPSQVHHDSHYTRYSNCNRKTEQDLKTG